MSEFILHIEKGQVGNKKAVRGIFGALADGLYKVVIKPWKLRSLRQNAYYHAVVCEMVKEGLQDVGYGQEVQDAEDAHEVLKALFLKKKVFNPDTGELLVERHGTTTKLSTTEFEEYLDKCRIWAAQYLGISIPLPNQSGDYFNNY